MKQKILKLIKILNKFTIDDILSMDDFDEKEVSETLSEFENSGLISKISAEEYIYFPNGKTEPQTSNRLYNLNKNAVFKRRRAGSLRKCIPECQTQNC
ncbi:MAG: hypothetical protein Q4F80_05935 [bacterium]|nr:hypothetical protein [bacterium]